MNNMVQDRSSIIIFYCEIVILAIVKWGREELKRQTDKKQR